MGKTLKPSRRGLGAWRSAFQNNKRLGLEPLEDRRLLALLGIVPTTFITYDSTGTIDYQNGTLSFALDATPLTFKATPISPTRNITGVRDFRVDIQVDNAGNLLGGVAGNDLVVTGDIDINGDSVVDVSGVLLTGEISQFGFLNAPSGTTDTFDFRFTPTGGALMNPYFIGKDIGLRASSENSNFTDFSTTFHGGAKGNLAPINPLLSSIAGNVYLDNNNNGAFETGLGETGIVGVPVALTGTTVDGTPVSLTTVTGVGGAYSFPALRAGNYTITETQPVGYLDGKDTQGTPGNGTVANDVFAGIFLGSGVNGVENNFGELTPASLAGNVYQDNNNNGLFETGLGETGIASATVVLTGTDDLGNAVSTSTTTNGAGAYAFGNLRPGTYTITETQPAGYLDGQDTQGTPGNGTAGNDVFSTITLASGVNGINNNFGELVGASLAGYVYRDDNNNGAFETGLGEPGILGATVTLTGTDDLGASVNLSTSTNAAGAYGFTDLRPGTYTITETQPAGYLDGQDTQGTPGNGTAGNDVFSSITLASGVNGMNNNFGELVGASLSGFVYRDDNNNGAFETGLGEPGIAGATVTLTGTDDLGGSVSMSTTTNAAGAYSFGNLRPGTYTITETQPAGYLDGQDTQGTPGNGTAGNDVFSTITLASGVNGVNNNFGELVAASIAGNVYQDNNNNGIFETGLGETGIAGATVTLTGTDDLGASVNLSTTTNGAGAYGFANLRPGTYTITETQPAGYLDGQDTQGTPGNGTTGNDVFSGITLASGVNGVNNNFGELVGASLAGFVYKDNNNNGAFETGLGETGIAGATVTLTGTDDLGGSVSMSTTTNGAGAYAFSNLRPGTYTITETQPVGYIDGKDTQGTPGNGTAGNDVFSTITLASGVNGVNNNFGELVAASIAGNVYKDNNNNGVFETGLGETGIASTTVTLTGTNDLGAPVSMSTTTNASGAYSFGNLRPGSYTITETQPAGFLDGKDTQGTPGNGTAGNDVFSNITLASGVNGVNNNFGELCPASLSGFVYKDNNNNGAFETGLGETGIAGATVTLTGTNDLGASVSMTTTTNASGAYSFGNLRPGSYTITETQPAGYTDGIDTQGTPGNGTTINDAFVAITLASNVNGVNNNFGERIVAGTISGTKWKDLTGNGKTADDTGLGGTKIYIDANNNGMFDTGEKYTTSAANGTYSFTGLAAGTYKVREVVPTDYVRTGPVMTDYYSVTVVAGQTVTGIDFANFEKCDDHTVTNIYYVINGSTVVTDLRGNVNEGDVVEVFFTLNTSEPVVFSLVSYTAPGATFVAEDADLQEIFDLASETFTTSGDYSLTVTVPHCYFQIDFVCGDAIDQFGPAGSNIFYSAQGRLFSADNDGTHACSYGGSLSGFVWADRDCDGVIDATELAIQGVKVVLTGTDKYGNAVNMTAYTDEDGMYLFDNLKAGTYKITETDPVGYNDGTDVIGSLGGTKSNDMFASIALATGRTGVNYNFGEVPLTQTLNHGQTATIAFWNNSSGQALIKQLNGGSTKTNLGTWLATNFPDMYGSSAGTFNMNGKTNSQIATIFQSLFVNASQKLEAQVLATALAVYSTNQTLAGGTYARTYGFIVNTTGTAAATMNVGDAGVALGVSDNAVLTIMEVLQRTSQRTRYGSMWDLNASGGISAAESFLRALALDLFTQINTGGSI